MSDEEFNQWVVDAIAGANHAVFAVFGAFFAVVLILIVVSAVATYLRRRRS